VRKPKSKPAHKPQLVVLQKQDRPEGGLFAEAIDALKGAIEAGQRVHRVINKIRGK
jgi:hypothetical protein